MRIGINASFARKPYTGIGQVTTQVLGSLPRVSGTEYVVYLEEAPDPGAAWAARDDVRVVAGLPALWHRDDLVRRTLWEWMWLPRQARRDGCDRLVSLYQSATVTLPGMRHTTLVHDIIPRLFPAYLDNWRKRWYQWLVERAIRRADRIVTISECSRDDLVRALDIPRDRIGVAAPDVDPIFRRPVGDARRTEVLGRYGLAPGYIYSGGGLEMRKNTPTLLAAYRRVLDRDAAGSGAVPPLVISGKLLPGLAPLVTDVERLVREMDLGPYVRVLGFVPQEDLPALYAGAELFVYPSIYEGFGLPVLEAMCQGVPVLCSNASSLPEVGGSAVEYFRPTDIEELARKIEELLHDFGRRREMDRAGRERARGFSWETIVGALFDPERKG